MTKPVRNISIVLILVVVAALLIVPKLLSEKNKNQATKQGPQDQTLQVDAVIVKSVDLENEVQTVGTILANEEVEIKSEVTRKISGIHFNEGTFVSKGKVLFKLDDSDLLARLRKLELDEELNTKQQDREQQLLDKGLLTTEEFEIRQTNIEKIRADIEIAEVDLDKTYIRAPFSGIAGFRNVSKGSLVNTAVVLTTLQDVSRVKVDFSIPEKYITAFKPGQGIKFKVEGFGEDFSGVVVSYDPKLDENTRTILLRAVADNRVYKLLPGSFVKVKLELENISNAILVPSQSIIPKLKGQSVYVIENGIAKLKDVEMGIRTEKDVQITSGINIGDTLITTNILRLKPDSKVKIANLN